MSGIRFLPTVATLLVAGVTVAACTEPIEDPTRRRSLATSAPAPGQEIFGQILGVSDDVLAQVRVAAVRVHATDGSHPQTSPAPDGRFRFTGVEPGQWTVQAVDLAFGRNVTAQVEVTAGGGPYERNLVLGGIATLTGSALADGEPLAGAGVMLTARNGVVHGAHVETASDGTFRAAGLVPGSYTLLLTEGPAVLARRTLELSADHEIHLELAVASLSGQVLDAAGEPVRRAHVQVVIPGRSEADGLGGSARTDAAGRFHFPHLLPDRYTVRAQVEGKAVASATVSLEAGDRRELELRWESGAGLSPP